MPGLSGNAQTLQALRRGSGNESAAQGMAETGGVMADRISDEVYASTEQDRHSKEVEFVASHDGDWIKSFLQGVHEKRGFEAYKRLRDDVAKLWRNNGTGKN